VFVFAWQIPIGAFCVYPTAGLGRKFSLFFVLCSEGGGCWFIVLWMDRMFPGKIEIFLKWLNLQFTVFALQDIAVLIICFYIFLLMYCFLYIGKYLAQPLKIYRLQAEPAAVKLRVLLNFYLCCRKYLWLQQTEKKRLPVKRLLVQKRLLP
jgi:hypothetical protein